jgi:tetratricopeptide (TPR) repeat protein
MKVLLFFLTTVLFITSSSAQSASFDKNQVLQYFQDQEYEEAVTYMQPLFNADSSNIELLAFLGYANYMNDNMKAAEAYYQKIFRLDSNNITAIRYLATIASNGQPEEAKMYVARLINLQPTKPVYYRNMADLLDRQNKKDSALLYYDKAYWLAPQDFKNHTGLLDVLLDKKTYARADSILTAGLLKDSLNTDYLKLRVRQAYETNAYQQVLLPGERLIRLNETPLNALTQLILSYYNLKQFRDCILVCEYMRANNIDIEAVYYYEALARAKLKEYRISNELLQLCLDRAISKSAEMYLYHLGQNYESLKQYGKAISQYDTAYYLFKDPIMNYNIGGIYEVQLKNNAMAKKYYTRYLMSAKPVTAEEKKAYEYVQSKWGAGEAKKKR